MSRSASRRLSVDSIFMMPHLGVLSTINEQAATDVFVRDCMVYLGTCVAPIGQGKDGERCADYEIALPDGRIEKGTLELRRPQAICSDSRTAGSGHACNRSNRLIWARVPGNPLTRTVQGGVVGLMLDGRGRPLQIAERSGGASCNPHAMVQGGRIVSHWEMMGCGW